MYMNIRPYIFPEIYQYERRAKSLRTFLTDDRLCSYFHKCNDPLSMYVKCYLSNLFFDRLNHIDKHVGFATAEHAVKSV